MQLQCQSGRDEDRQANSGGSGWEPVSSDWCSVLAHVLIQAEGWDLQARQRKDYACLTLWSFAQWNSQCLLCIDARNIQESRDPMTGSSDLPDGEYQPFSSLVNLLRKFAGVRFDRTGHS